MRIIVCVKRTQSRNGIYKDLVEYIEKCKQKIAEKPWNFEEIDPCTFCPFDTWEQVTIC